MCHFTSRNLCFLSGKVAVGAVSFLTAWAFTARMKRNTRTLRDGTGCAVTPWALASLVLKVRAGGRDRDLWESADLQSLLLLPCDLGQVILLPVSRTSSQPSVFRMDSHEP